MKSLLRASLVPLFAFTLILTGCQGIATESLLQSQSQTVSRTAQSPIVTSTSPTGDVAPNKISFIAFSMPMDESTLTTDNIFIKDVRGTVTYDRANRIAYVRPASNLTANREYRLVVSKNVRARSGVAMGRNFSFSFLTRERISSSIPSVELLPGPCISPDGKIRVRFSEAMDSSTINAESFLVAGVTGAVTYDALTRIATFTPSAPLTAGATYSVTIKASAKDLGGVSMAADFAFTVEICEEQQDNGYCSYTKGGYQGNGTPGQLMVNNFEETFPQDMFIGLSGETHYRWTSNQAGIDSLREFLTSPAGGLSGPLPISRINPTATESGNLPTQVATLTLNVAFSGTEHVPAGFGDLVLQNTGTSLDGASVSAILAFANEALAGAGLPEGYTFSSLNDLITNLNESWDDCAENAWAKEHLREPSST